MMNCINLYKHLNSSMMVNIQSTVWIISIIGALFVLAYSTPLAQAQESTDSEEIQIRVISNVAAQHTENGEGYDIEYILSVPLEDEVIINPEEKTLTFNVAGNGMPSEDILEIRYSKEILDFPIRVLIDGVHEPDSVQSGIGEMNTMFIPLKEGSKEIKIKGITVIPEFGSIAALILVISITTIIIFTSTKKISSFSLR